MPKQLEQSGRKEPALEMDQSLVEIGQGETASDRLTLKLRDQGQLRIDNLFKAPGHVVELLFIHGNEAPIRLPGTVVNRFNPLQLVVIIRHLDTANRNPTARLHLLDHLLHPFRYRILADDPVCDQVHNLLQPEFLRQPRKVRLVEGHHDRRRRVETLDKKSAFVVGGEVHRPAHLLHAGLFERNHRHFQESGGDLVIIGTIKKTEETDLLFMNLVVIVVDAGCDAPDHLLALHGQEKFHRGGFVERVLLAVEKFLALGEQRGDIIRLTPVKIVGITDEFLQLCRRFDFSNFDVRHSGDQLMRPFWRPTLAIISTTRSRCSSVWVAV